jgi:hypothetical protein
LTQEREKSSTDELHNKICHRVFFVLRVAQVKKAKDLFSDKLQEYVCSHSRHSTILPFFLPFRHSVRHSAIPPFRHSAIPPFRHSAISTIPTYKLPTYIQTYEVEKWDLNGLGRHFFNEINY